MADWSFNEVAYTETIEKEGLVEKQVKIKRVAKTIKGGRMISWTALCVVGDSEGRVGYGLGKARERMEAIEKSGEIARRNMYEVELNGTTLWYPIMERYGASRIYMQPASEGTGIIAGGTMRAVLEAAGVRDVLAKIYGSTTPINVVRATINGLVNMRSPRLIALKRDKTEREVRA